MKNFILSLLACAISFSLTFWGLNKYGKAILPHKTEQQIEEIQEVITEDAIENNMQSENDDVKIDEDEEITETEIVEETPKKTYTINANIAALEQDYKAWSNYNKENIELSYEFTPVDVDDTVIEKEDFLNRLNTGFYIPLKVDSEEFIYKLHKLSETANPKIGKSIRGSSAIAYSYFKKEGEALPEFDFVDLDGNKYNKKTTKGKIKVIKCWFINCVVCVQEFPELNDLYDRYEGNDNVAFLSLAFDKPEKLKKFLVKKEFRYPVIAEQKKYMSKKLEIKQYPTHLIVDEDNNIIKMVNNVKALTVILDQLIGSEEFNSDDEKELEIEFQ